MPELPEIETIRRGLQRELPGRKIKSVEICERRLRLPVDAEKLQIVARGQAFERIERRAKYLVLHLQSGAHLVIHLGMSGCLLLSTAGTQRQSHVHVVFHLDDGRELRFRDSRRFGLVEALEQKEQASFRFFQNLGVEPFADTFNAEHLFRASRRLKKPIKNFLMDSRVIVGVGNIYASESLFLAKIHPRKPAGKLSKKNWRALVLAVRQTLQRAIDRGGTTLNDFQNSNGELGYFQNELKVYDRAGKKCRRCKSLIRRVVLAGRSTFYCVKCQRR